MTPPARVLLVDDHAAVRHGLCAMLEPHPELDPVATAGSSREALGLMSAARPEVVLVDYHLPDEDGLALCLRLKTYGGHEAPPRVLLYSAFADDLLTLLGAVAGADGLVSKASLAAELCTALLAVSDGQRLMGPPAPETMRTALAGVEPDDLPIVGMLINGIPPDEIAATLDVNGDWLVARRWAILAQLRRRPGRRAI